MPLARSCCDDLEIAGHDALLAIEHEDEQVGVGDRLLALLGNHRWSGSSRRAEHAAGVEQRERDTLPLHGLLDHIARRARHGRDDGAPSSP